MKPLQPDDQNLKIVLDLLGFQIIKEVSYCHQKQQGCKKAHPCKVEVIDYTYQNNIASCKRLERAVQKTCKISTAEKDSMVITAELPSIIAKKNQRLATCVVHMLHIRSMLL